MISCKMFTGRKLLIATKHEKEKVIAPVLEKSLGVVCFTHPGLDTDKLGTFAGEVERKDDPITTARKKCLMAMELSNCDLVLASEGSFGSHPAIFYAAADDEFLIFIYTKNNLEIIARELSTETNFNGTQIKTENELNTFAKSAQFPQHGLMIKNKKENFTEIVKGITNPNQLKNTFQNFISKYQQAFVETDMRAMFNPSRMKVIEQAAKNLAEKINSRCPNCKIPGFGITETQQGLPCERCNFPTRSTLNTIYTCQKCGFAENLMYPHGKKTEDPMYCDICNP